MGLNQVQPAQQTVDAIHYFKQYLRRINFRKNIKFIAPIKIQ